MDTERPKSPVIMRVKGKRGLALKPLVWGPDPPPFADESLMGLLARTASRNGFRSLSRVVRLADVDTRYTPGLPSTHASSSGTLALLLRVDEAEVSSRMHPEMKVDGRRANHIDFFGTILRARYREGLVRRVSPRSLTVSAYHRAMWDLRPYSFCVESRETLLSRCPVCGTRLGWRSTHGVHRCETCEDDEGNPTVDLRDFPQPLVEVSDEEALAFVCDVIHPDPARRERARRAVATEFSGLSSAELFETVMAVACASTGESGTIGKSLRKFGSLDGYARLTPEVLARASRVVMTWPRPFCDIAQEMRVNSASRHGANGLLKEIGGLALLAWDQELPEQVRTTFAKGNETFMGGLEDRMAGLARFRRGLVPEGFITQKEAARRLRMRAVDVRPLADRTDVTSLRMTNSAGPVLYRADEIERIDLARRDLTDGHAVALRVGIPLWAVLDLAGRGHLAIETGPAAALRSGGHLIRTSTVEALLAALWARVLPKDDASRASARLVTVIARAARCDMPWGEVIEGILDGALTLRSIEVPKASFTYNVAVEDVGQLEALVAKASPTWERARMVPMNDLEASVALGTTSFTVCKLIEAGLLGSNGAPFRRIAVDDIVAFQARYAFTPEVAASMGTKNADVRKRLAALGIHPVAEFGDGKQLVWSREETSLPARG